MGLSVFEILGVGGCDVHLVLLLGTDHLTWRGVWFFVSFRIFSSDNTRVRLFIFFQNLTLDFMTKTLNQIIYFFLHQNQNIFFNNIGNQNIFLEKKHTSPPFQVKWSFPYLVHFKINVSFFDGACFVSIVILCSNGILMTLPVVYVPLN